jgi:predicted amidohydrolase YtcJ
LHQLNFASPPLRTLCFTTLGLLIAAACAAAPQPLVLFNGKIYTGNAAQPRAEAVLAIDGRIVAVGTRKNVLSRTPTDARRIDLKGHALFPGFTDAHAHLAGIGFRDLMFDLEGVASLAELKDRLRKRVAATEPGDWIEGRGWIESRWSPAKFPTRQDLDEVAADRAVVLTRADGHALVANSLALERANIDRDTADPPGGKIEKDPATGEPTGMLIDEAMKLVQHLIPSPTDKETLNALESGARRSVRLGWTQLQYAGTSWKEVDLLCQLRAAGRLDLRVYVALDGPGNDADRLLKEGPSPQRCGDRVTVRAIKLYIDGALGSRGAALLSPYNDAPATDGLLVNSADTLLPTLIAALKRGIQIETHAIGDRGNRIILDLYEKAFAAVPREQRAVKDPRWRIEHAQVLSQSDIPRFAKLGVIASMQPSHAIGDLFFAPQRLGADRLTGAYAWRSLLDAGVIIAAGSDAPVEKGDPRIEFYAAVARKSIDGFADTNWHLEQRVSREQALNMLTLAPAVAAFEEHSRGSIEIGKQADFSVFSSDLMQVPDAEILQAEPVLTIIGGEVAYERN